MFHAGADNTNRVYSSGKEWGIWSGASNDHVAFKVTASDTDPAIELYYNNSKKFETNSSGASVTGTLGVSNALNVTGLTTLSDSLLMGDNVIAKFGASSDLRLYHNGTHSYVQGYNIQVIYI